jgi:hypothetical protein
MLALFTSTLLHFLPDTRLQAFFDGKKTYLQFPSERGIF